ncbi:hypothetical protein IFVP5_C190183 [Vibrio parahaemolyticus]|nr:hypothetical protein D046_8799 [Vibrio parahaemolyticus V-223/04]
MIFNELFLFLICWVWIEKCEVSNIIRVIYTGVYYCIYSAFVGVIQWFLMVDTGMSYTMSMFTS